MKRALTFAAKYLFAGAASAFLFTVGVVSRRHRALINIIAVHFGWRAQPRQVELPVVHAGELFAEDLPVRLLSPQVADGNVTLYELAVLMRSVVARRPLCLLELGTFDGRTTLNLAANAPKGARVHTLDLPADSVVALPQAAGDHAYVDKPAPGVRFAGHALSAGIVQLNGDTATFDFSSLEGRCDWVFVDAAHSHEYVLNDSAVARRVLAPGGIIFWHDYGAWDGVTSALNELQRTDEWFAGLRRIEGTTLAVLLAP